MKELLNEYIRNKRGYKINLIILTFSIILCLMFLSYIEQKILSDSIVNIKSQNVKYHNPKLNNKIIQDLEKFENINYFYITYKFPDELEKYFDEEV
ncbi:hypothetical protein [Helcococcus kunzii]|uniref:hypothetical protein n=1 Tax=Helcococcus kunzii TaxID=40091 RepID=UPI0021A7AF57|nr:hypothetical protein [Helcococcus kunzii]MCT1795411.1 hypothetical protein [Helcococcus kunzii]